MGGERREEALARGEVEIRVKRAGMYQVLPFRVERVQTPFGAVPYLVSPKQVDLPELMKIAEEYSLPVKSPSGKIYPRGKMEKDFAGI